MLPGRLALSSRIHPYLANQHKIGFCAKIPSFLPSGRSYILVKRQGMTIVVGENILLDTMVKLSVIDGIHDNRKQE